MSTKQSYSCFVLRNRLSNPFVLGVSALMDCFRYSACMQTSSYSWLSMASSRVIKMDYISIDSNCRTSTLPSFLLASTQKFSKIFRLLLMYTTSYQDLDSLVRHRGNHHKVGLGLGPQDHVVLRRLPCSNIRSSSTVPFNLIKVKPLVE